MSIMKAVLIDKPGEADQLYIGDSPMPKPAHDELLVKVYATALNRADIHQRKGHYPPPKGASAILGLEMSGVVVSAGPRCPGWRRGDRVFALLPGGGYAQYVTIPARMALPIPENLTFEQAAAVPEAFLTAFQGLMWLGQLRAGERVLIHAGASGVGSAAIQLAKGRDAVVYTTAGSREKTDFCLQLGASLAINYRENDFSAKVLEVTDGEGVHLVLDFIGASYWQQNLNALSRDGRLILLATMGGGKVEQADLRTILLKRLNITGSTLRARSNTYKAELTNAFARKILPGFSDGLYRPVIDSVFPMEKVAEAHQRMEANENSGKIILRIADS